MTPSDQRWQRLGELFDAALDRSDPEREAWLVDACGEDSSLLAEVREMLAAHERAGGVLDAPLSEVAAEALARADGVFPAGTQVGPYRIIEEIGRGGMGIVYKAHDPRLGRLLALKFLPASPRADSAAERRFLAEARAASALDHPSICTIYDIGETEGGQRYIAMAYYEGITLAERLARGPLPVGEAVDVAIQLAAGLDRAHEAGITHRDIKPSNVIVTGRGEARILDFGVAKLEGEARGGDPARVGTVAYMSPEQARGEEVDRRTDLWSLGVVLYEMIAGRSPFSGGDLEAVLAAVQTAAPAPLVEVRPDVPTPVVEVVERLLAKSPEDRFARAADVREALDAWRTLPAGGSAHALGKATLPSLLTSFVGRERETEQVASLLGESRLVTLTGPAGTGKTRLALRAVEVVAGRFDGGAYFVSLGGVTDPGAVPSRIVEGLGIRRPATLPSMECLRASIGERALVVVLDNFEQVAGAAPAVADLLAACPNLRVLVTSRTPLRLRGEREFAVAPLDVPPRVPTSDFRSLGEYSAVRLFVERARAVRPDFHLSADDAPAVAALCARLDGLPLAIELAAARLKLFSPAGLLSRLGDRLEILAGGPRDGPVRHQTLRRAIDWSYDLLDEGEKRFFRRMSVFMGGWTLDRVEALERIGSPTWLDVVEALTALVDHSLVVRDEAGVDSEPRFRMLETIRAYAAVRLRDAGEVHEARRAHARVFLDVAERAEPELTGEHQAEWLDRLEVEHDNFRSALEWARENAEAEVGLRLGAALWRFWVSRGHIREGRRWLAALLDLPGDGVTRATRARALGGIAMLAQNQGDNMAAREALRECLSLWRAEGDRTGIAQALTSLAWISCEVSDLESAEEMSREALALCRSLGERRGIALNLNNLGWVAVYRGEHRAAWAYHEESLALREAIGDRRGAAFARCNLAWTAHLAGDDGRAIALVEEARTVLAEIHDRLLSGWARWVYAWIELDGEDLDRAERSFEEAMALAREGGNLSIEALAGVGLAEAALERGDPETAERLLTGSVRIWESIGSVWGLAWALDGLAGVALLHGEPEKAGRWCLESLSSQVGIGDRRGAAASLRLAARIALARGEPDRAAAALGLEERFREETRTPLPLRERQRHERDLADMRRAMASDELRTAWERGRALGLDRATEVFGAPAEANG